MIAKENATFFFFFSWPPFLDLSGARPLSALGPNELSGRPQRVQGWKRHQAGELNWSAEAPFCGNGRVEQVRLTERK